MIGQLSLVLLALVEQTGIQKFINYEISNEEIINICDDIDYSFNENSIISIEDIYSLDASNKYVFITSNAYWYLINKENKTLSQFGTFSNNPYLNLENEFKIYNPTNIEFTYGVYYEEFINIENNEEINFFNLNSYLSNLSNSNDVFDSNNGMNYQEDTVLIDNAFYFQNLGNRHSYNIGDSCCIVAGSILLGYFDTFYNDNIIDEAYDLVSLDNETNCSLFTHSPGYGKYSKNDSNLFHQLLETYANQYDNGDYGMDTGEQWCMIKDYLDDKNISYTEYMVQGNPLDLYDQKAKNVIKDAINNNLPVIANGVQHSVVAYGYDDEYVYVHTGWGHVARTPWSTYTSASAFYYPGALKFDITSDHVHSNNYYSTIESAYLCPCDNNYSNPCNLIAIDSSSTITLNRSLGSKFHIFYTASDTEYVSFKTDIDDYDVSFENIITLFDYNYVDDIDNESDYSNYNPLLTIDRITTGGTVKFVVDLTSVPINTELITFTIELNEEEEE